MNVTRIAVAAAAVGGSGSGYMLLHQLPPWRLATVSWRKNLFIIEHSRASVCVFLVSFYCCICCCCCSFFFMAQMMCSGSHESASRKIYSYTHRAQWKQQTNRWCSTNGQNNDTTTKTHTMSARERIHDLFVRACECAPYLRTQRLTLILPRIFLLLLQGGRECSEEQRRQQWFKWTQATNKCTQQQRKTENDNEQ